MDIFTGGQKLPRDTKSLIFATHEESFHMQLTAQHSVSPEQWCSAASKHLQFTSKQKENWGSKIPSCEESHSIWLAATLTRSSSARSDNQLWLPSLQTNTEGEKWSVCTHKETLNNEVYEIHYRCSRPCPGERAIVVVVCAPGRVCGWLGLVRL